MHVDMHVDKDVGVIVDMDMDVDLDLNVTRTESLYRRVQETLTGMSCMCSAVTATQCSATQQYHCAWAAL